MNVSRRTLLSGAAGVGALGLAACSSSKAGSSSSAASGPIQFYQSGDANQGGGYAKMAALYEQQTGKKVEVVEVAYADLPTKIKNAAQANALPALARMPSIDPVWKDRLVDLKDIVTANKVKSGFVVQEKSGKALSLPSDITAVGMFLNKTLWDKAGVKYPTTESGIWTWDEFVAAAKQVQASAGAKYGLVFDRSSHREKALMFEFGSTWWLPDSSGTYTTNDATKTALTFFKSITDDKFMPKSVWLSNDDPNALFKSGQVAAYYSGSWQIADFAANIKNFEWASVYLPKQPVRSSNFGEAAEMVIFDGTGQEQPAHDFLNWLYTPANYQKLCEYSVMLPAVEGVTPNYSANKDALTLYNQEIAASPDIVGKVKQNDFQNMLSGKSVSGDPVRDETVKFLNGQQDVDTTVSNVSKSLTSAFK
ncbi:MAG TPA: extracellular solute-binding protein [Propionibacteriaceae bacterium]|nr:extracellular solute-binding protein [Propionibacteriaceae bacterium]